MVIFGRTSALLLAMVVLLFAVELIYLDLSQVRASGYLTTLLAVKLSVHLVVAEAGFEPATQRL